MGLVELADLGKDVEEPVDMGMGVDVVEQEKEELNMADLANMVELADVGKQHK